MALNQEQKKFRKLHKNQGGYGESVTKSDSRDLGEKKAELFIGTGGNVKVSLYGGSVVTLKNIPSGTFLKKGLNLQTYKCLGIEQKPTLLDRKFILALSTGSMVV